MSVAMNSAVAMKLLSKKTGMQVHALTLYEINEAIKAKTTKEEWRKQILVEYHEFLDLFDEKRARELAPHRSYHNTILLIDGKEPPFGPLYGMSRDDLIALQEYIEKNLSKGFIRASSSPAGATVLFIKKGDGSLRPCVDYRGIN